MRDPLPADRMSWKSCNVDFLLCVMLLLMPVIAVQMRTERLLQLHQCMCKEMVRQTGTLVDSTRSRCGKQLRVPSWAINFPQRAYL